MSALDSASRFPAHPGMAWTSFDRFGRYAAIVRCLRTAAPSVGSVADVGDRSGYLRQFLPDVESVAFDLEIEPNAFDDRVMAVASGIALPTPDGRFDAVVSSDVLEHVPRELRPAFLRELVRVSAGPIVVAAPFDTFGVAGVESMVSRFATVTSGHVQPQLAEHETFGLPDLDATIETFTTAGCDVDVVGDGNLFDWLGMMLLRLATEVRADMAPLSDGFDVVYNRLLSARSDVGPYYRHLLVASPATGPTPVVHGLEAARAAADTPPDATAAAFVTHLVLATVTPRLNHIDHALGAIAPEVASHLAGLMDQAATQHAETARRLDQIEAAIQPRSAELGRRAVRRLRRGFRSH